MDIKGANLIKSVRLEGLRILGQPNEFALDYYKQGIDELIYMDCVASLYGRNSLSGLVSTAIENIFVPLTVGGGIRSIDDVFELLRAGADKVAVNTAVVNDPQLITQIVNKFGSQCLVLSIDAKLNSKGKWEVLTESGRERTGLDALDWAIKGAELGVGEILLTSVDREGTRQGFDVELVRLISESVSVPVIASGGLRTAQDFVSVIKETSGEHSSYTCSICGFEYNPEEGDPALGIPPGTPFEDLPDDYKCPICNAGKDYFKKN